MTDIPRFCTDRILPREAELAHRTVARGDGLRAIVVARKLWVNGSTLHVRFLGGTAEQHRTVRDEAARWTEHANLTFVFDDDPRAQIRVAFDERDGAWSQLGTDATATPVDRPTMNLGFLDPGTATHEFGHAIGLVHEHQNPEGGIRWNEAQVLRDLAGPPNYWTEAETRHNVLEKYSVEESNGTEFDPRSVMLYFFPASWTLDGVGTSANTVLSDLDKSFVASSAAYPRLVAPPQDVAKELLVGASRRTSSRIGAPGEQDLYRFTVDEAGVHVVDTSGSTDLVLDLFGPDRPTALLASDDDGGTGLNPRVVLPLRPGAYYARVRHYAPSGTGRYTVRVRRADTQAA